MDDLLIHMYIHVTRVHEHTHTYVTCVTLSPAALCFIELNVRPCLKHSYQRAVSILDGYQYINVNCRDSYDEHRMSTPSTTKWILVCK